MISGFSAQYEILRMGKRYDLISKVWVLKSIRNMIHLILSPISKANILTSEFPINFGLYNLFLMNFYKVIITYYWKYWRLENIKEIRIL